MFIPRGGWNAVVLGSAAVLAAVSLVAEVVRDGSHTPLPPGIQAGDYEELGRHLARLGYRTHRFERDYVAEGPGVVLPTGHQLKQRLVLAGLYLVRSDDPRSWEEIAGRPRATEALPLWQGIVVARRRIAATQPPSGRDDFVLGPFVFYGDPTLLDEVARRLGE
jgi:hypothetical protein